MAYAGVENLEVLREARRYNAFLVREVLAAAGGPGPMVDFGAGTGTFAAALAERGAEVLCVEPDEALRARLGEQGLVAEASLQALAPGSLPFVYSLNVLEHIEDDLGALQEIRGRLAPGGVLFLYVPAFPVLYSSMDERVGHHRRYRLGPLSDRVRAAGLSVERAEHVDSLGFLASLVYKAVGSESGDLSRRAVAAYDRLVFPVSRVLDRVARRVAGKNLLLVARR